MKTRRQKPATPAPAPKGGPATGTVASWREQPWAEKVPNELAESLDNFESDDKAPPTLAMAVEEAAYIIGLHSESGTESQAMLAGERGREARTEAKKTIRDCEAFIKRHKTEPQPS